MLLLSAFQVPLLLSLESLCVPDKGNRLYDPVLDPFMPASRRIAIADTATSRVTSKGSLDSGTFVHGDA